jgi:RimJ/RimL family protein N-acetyltransferase
LDLRLRAFASLARNGATSHFRRQGYAQEACEALLMKWAYEERQVTRFVVTTRPNNTPSIRLAEHFGFRRIGSHIDEVDGLEDIYLLEYGESWAAQGP